MELLDNIKQYHCKYRSINGTQCEEGDTLMNTYNCYKNNCFEEKTDNVLCINTDCTTQISNCLIGSDNGECGRMYLEYLDFKQSCYDAAFVESGSNRCRCRQEGDGDTYYVDTAYDQSPDCINNCDQCDVESYSYLSKLCTDDNCPQEFLNILGCIKSNCTEEYNQYINQSINISNYINDIELCGYDVLCQAKVFTMLGRC